MREAMGGTVLIQLVMIFIVIYAAFLAIAINYSIAFRVKNNIINLIEEYNGLNNADTAIDDYVNSIGYYKSNTKKVIAASNCEKAYGGGYCIEKKSATGVDSSSCTTGDFKCTGVYYKVTTYISFDFPIIGNNLLFPVSGETKIIYDAN